MRSSRKPSPPNDQPEGSASLASCPVSSSHRASTTFAVRRIDLDEIGPHAAELGPDQDRTGPGERIEDLDPGTWRT
jgi:hypothetical protein